MSCGKNTGKTLSSNLNGCKSGFYSAAFDYAKNFGVGANIDGYYYDDKTKN